MPAITVEPVSVQHCPADCNDWRNVRSCGNSPIEILYGMEEVRAKFPDSDVRAMLGETLVGFAGRQSC